MSRRWRGPRTRGSGQEEVRADFAFTFDHHIHEVVDLLGDALLFREHRLAPFAVLHGVSDWFYV